MSGSSLLPDLICRTARQDRAAFAELYRRAAPQLFGIALRISSRREIAEDVLQESFVAVWIKAADFDPQRGSAMAWLVSIVRNNAIDYMRRRAARPEGRAVSDPETLLASLTAADRTDGRADARALQHCLDQLEAMPRRAVTLAYVYGLTRDELAAQLHVPVGTVKSWIRRSLERLQRCLDG